MGISNAGSRFWCFSCWNYKSAYLLYCILFIALTSNFLILGEVTAPHRQDVEVGVVDADSHLSNIQNRKFSDYTNSYVPELSENLNGARSGWLVLWTNKNELGRPTYQVMGFGSAYVLSWIISKFTNNPWRFITTLSLLYCFMAGSFLISFCKEIGLSSFAGLIAASSLATAPFFMYWLTFPMFLAVFSWAAGALWAVTRLARAPDLLAWSVLAFSGYSLLMTAYPQLVVYHIYILTAYFAFLTFKKNNLTRSERLRFALIVVSAVFVAIILSLPVYIDLARDFLDSARVAPGVEFFSVILPKFDGLLDVWRFVVLSATPELLGIPISSKYPFTYNGISLTLFAFFFIILAVLLAWRKTWGWWVAIVSLCLLSASHSIFEIGVEYFGLNLSRSSPLCNAIIPFSVILAYGVDTLIERTTSSTLSRAVCIACSCAFILLLLGLGFALDETIPIRWGSAFAMLAIIVLCLAQRKQTRPALLIIALLVTLGTISYPLMLHEKLEQIATASPLVETVRENLPKGARFAIVAPGLTVLPPNLNSELGLASVHSYNSLSPRRYHNLINELGGQMLTYGRWNSTISPDYDSPAFWMSNIGIILSPQKITNINLKYLGTESGVYIYKVNSVMGDSVQVRASQVAKNPDGTVEMADPRTLTTYPSARVLDNGDAIEINVTVGVQSVLVLSQKYHRNWVGQVFTQGQWVPARTALVNGVFQGVIVPKDATIVRLEFRPYVRYSWIAHIFWVLLLLLLGLNACKRRVSILHGRL
jgi:hypothetical protein